MHTMNKELFYTHLLHGSAPLTLAEDLSRVYGYQEGVEVIETYENDWFLNCLIDYEDFIKTYEDLKGRIVLNKQEEKKHKEYIGKITDVTDATIERSIFRVKGKKEYTPSRTNPTTIYILYAWYKALGYRFYEDDMERIRQYRNEKAKNVLIQNISKLCGKDTTDMLTKFFKNPSDKFIRMALEGKASKELYAIYVNNVQVDAMSLKEFHGAVSKDLFYLYHGVRQFAIKVCRSEDCKKPKLCMKDFSTGKYQARMGTRYYMLSTCKHCYAENKERKESKPNVTTRRFPRVDKTRSPTWAVIKR